MFKFSELKQIHLEITNNCQASCPMCSRNHHGGLDNPWLTVNQWTIDDYKKIITPEVINQTESLYFCGNYGDPAMNKDLIKMIRYTVEVKPSINIRVHTNGSIQSTKWWKELASAMPAQHMVIWGIDGLEDTNHIYRIGTSFKKIMDNAQAFIEAGGNSDWAFIVFKHNENQLKEAEKKAYAMGFKIFTHKNSNRFMLERSFPVLDKQGKTLYTLEPPSESKIVFIDKKVIENYKQIVKDSTIDCYAVKQKEVYIDAFGHLFPCCFIALTPYNFYERDNEVVHIRDEVMEQYRDLLTDFGGIDNLDTRKRSVKDIIDSNEYQTVWAKWWNDPKMITCARTCGTNNISKPTDQFIKRENFNE